VIGLKVVATITPDRFWLNSQVLRLTDDEYEGVLRVVREVSLTTNRDDFGRTALREIGSLVNSDVSALNEVDPAADRLVYVSDPEDYAIAPDAPMVFARLAPSHPLIRHYTDTGDGSAIKISDFWSVDTWHDSALYREFYRPLGVEHQMSIALPAPRPIIVAIVVNRVDLEADFNERERTILNTVRPHLAQAWRRARDYERLLSLVTTAGSALTSSGNGVVVLEDQPYDLTAGALASLGRFFGRPGPRDALPAAVRDWLDEQRAAAPISLARPLRRIVDGRQLIVRYLPANAGSSAALLLDEAPVRPTADGLRSLGLTEREAEVLSLLSLGAANAEIATRLSVSLWTVKRHLANIYAKLGVSSRIAAAALVLEITGHHGHLE
jgi:DNA-binding NarL/FixJ family response regulator